MKNKMLPLSLLLLVALSLAIFIACDKDDEASTGTLSLNFKLTYDGDPVSMYEDRFEYFDGTSIFFDRFMLFISNVSLPDADQEILDVALLDFSNIQDESAAERGVTVQIPNFPVGNHEALQIGLGLAPELNATTPADYSSSHPLANLYWEQWNSYISMVVEGKADTLGNGMHDLVLTYHIGKDPAYSKYTLQKSFQVKSDKTTTLNLEFDLKKLFSDNGESLDIRKYPIDHSTNEDVYNLMRLNMANAIGVSAL